MELGTAIIGLAVIIACVIPFVFISRSNKKRKMQFLQTLSDLAETNNCTILQYDIWNNAGIGTDESFTWIFFYKKAGDLEIRQQIELIEIEKCQVLNTGRTIIDKSGELKFTDKIELAFTPKDNSKNETVLVFFDANSDSLTLSGELQLANKWCKIANDKISSLTHQK